MQRQNDTHRETERLMLFSTLLPDHGVPGSSIHHDKEYAENDRTTTKAVFLDNSLTFRRW